MNDKKIKLGVNVDHVATLREARKITIPDPSLAAFLAEEAGCDSVVVHLREDRRHIKEKDVHYIKENNTTRLNLEMSTIPEIVNIALDISPDQVTFVPERRKEVTTEGGLNVKEKIAEIKKITKQFHKKNILVNLFIDPEEEQIRQSKETGAEFIELHTGQYVNAANPADRKKELERLTVASEFAHSLGLIVNAGHGLNYDNVKPVISSVPFLEELNIGHSIIARSVFVGIKQAVKEMLNLLHS